MSPDTGRELSALEIEDLGYRTTTPWWRVAFVTRGSKESDTRIGRATVGNSRIEQGNKGE